MEKAGVSEANALIDKDDESIPALSQYSKSIFAKLVRDQSERCDGLYEPPLVNRLKLAILEDFDDMAPKDLDELLNIWLEKVFNELILHDKLTCSYLTHSYGFSGEPYKLQQPWASKNNYYFINRNNHSYKDLEYLYISEVVKEAIFLSDELLEKAMVAKTNRTFGHQHKTKVIGDLIVKEPKTYKHFEKLVKLNLDYSWSVKNSALLILTKAELEKEFKGASTGEAVEISLYAAQIELALRSQEETQAKLRAQIKRTQGWLQKALVKYCEIHIGSLYELANNEAANKL